MNNTNIRPRIHAYPRAFSFALLALAIGTATVPKARALTFNFTATPQVNAQVLAGAQAAGNYWSSVLSDNMNVNIMLSISPNTSGVISYYGAAQSVITYSSFRNALALDSTSLSDQLATNSLTTANNFGMLLNRTTENPFGSGSLTPYLDNDNDANNRSLSVSSANLKALGLISPFTTTTDASITFGSHITWDFDRSNGISAGTYDFFGTAVREIGHALGFSSGVAYVDAFPFGPVNDANILLTPLDLYRYSTASASLGVIDASAGTSTKYFSLDRGITNLGNFATGRVRGDGNETNSWRNETPSLGIMDPNLLPGELGIPSPRDLLAFDVIGYNLANPIPIATPVPEPSTYALGAAALLGLLIYRRKKST